MAGLSQNLKAVITFGGNIDSSWNRSANDLQKSLKGVGTQSEKLTKEQSKLAAEIKRAALAGQSLGDLKRRYSDVTREIRKTEAEQQKLNQQMQKAQRMDAFKRAGKGLLSRGAGVAGGVLAMGGAGVVASALGAMIAPAAINAETARSAGVAKSYGVDVPTFNAWDTLAKQYDMSGENIGDLFERYLQNAGEYKQNGKQGSLQDAFETLGFKAGDLAGLSDIAQFEKIVDRAFSLQDESKASFALDSLLGGEASKLLMLMKQSGKSYRELMEEQRRYNLVTQEGAEGAMESNRAVTSLGTVFSSALAEISGQLGKDLAPHVRNLTDDLAEWFKGGGIRRIIEFIRGVAYPALITFGQGAVLVGKVVFALAKKLSWLLPDERDDQRDVLKSLAMTDSVDIARMVAQSKGQGEWFEQQLKEKPTLPEDVKKSYRETRGFFSNDNEGFDKSLDKYLTPENSGPLFGRGGAQNNSASASGDGGYWDALLQRLDSADQQPQARQLTDNRRFEYRFEINGAPGQSEQGIADAVEGVTKTSPAFTGDSSMMDGGQIW